ncbi:AI-2E family transporter [Arthrobacter sp. MYb227]|uniref:AI-2E family transporter n=1 Tax=Arthrobacter sp. MYb227 TaxID=1848601 RepID=UPI0035BE58B5
MTTDNGDETREPGPAGGPAEGTAAGDIEIPGKLTGKESVKGSLPAADAARAAAAAQRNSAPQQRSSSTPLWRKLVGRTQRSFDLRIKPPADFGFPPVPPHDPTQEPVPAASGPQAHPVAFGFLFTVGVGLALLGYFLLTNVGSLVIWIAVALFIALGLDPIVRFFIARGLSRTVGVLITIVLLLGVAGGLIGTIIPTIVTQTSQFIERAPEIVDGFLKSEFFVNLDKQYQVSDRISEEITKFFSDTGAVGGIFGGVLGVGSVVAQGMFGALIVLVLAIYFLASLPALKAFGYRLAPRSKRESVQKLGDTITRSVGNYVMGQAFVALLNAAVALTLMSILKVPFAALLTMFVAILAFIPLVGAVIAGILVSLISLTLGWQSAVIYAACYFSYLQLEAYFVSPRVMQKAVSVPGAVAVISVIAGGTLLGVAGALMAIPTAAAAMLILREVFITRQDQR